MSGKQRWDKTSCFMGPGESPATAPHITNPEWYGLQETFPELHALVACLTAGPVAIGDGIGDADATLVRRTARSDGVLLKPDRPALALDSVYFQEAFGKGGPKGEVTATFVEIGKLRWRFILGAALEADYDVTASDFAYDGSGKETDLDGVAWSRTYGDAFGPPEAADLVEYGTGPLAPGPLRLTLPAQASEDDWGKYTLWRTAPRACEGLGWALLGEMDKLISISKQRFSAVTPICGAYSGFVVDLIGAPGEAVTISFADVRGQILSKQVTISSSGTARFTLTSAYCIMW